jgi:thymidylate synthase (FAD)
MAHVVVPEAEAILDQAFPVLDKGFVRLVDYLGSDERIVAAARVSYGKGTKTVREDALLIDYLMSHFHTSPFEQVVLTFHVKLPIFVARQWVRHRTARLNEISGRYSVMKDEFYLPTPESLRTQSEVNKQGRSETTLSPGDADAVVGALEEGQTEAYDRYERALSTGLAREVARIGLPLSLYTEWYWQIDLSNLFRFLKLRLDSHAQWEIREYAKIMATITKTVAPMAYEAFERHWLHAVTLSREASEWLRENLPGGEIPKELREKLGK